MKIFLLFESQIFTNELHGYNSLNNVKQQDIFSQLFMYFSPHKNLFWSFKLNSTKKDTIENL